MKIWQVHIPQWHVINKMIYQVWNRAATGCSLLSAGWKSKVYSFKWKNLRLRSWVTSHDEWSAIVSIKPYKDKVQTIIAPTFRHLCTDYRVVPASFRRIHLLPTHTFNFSTNCVFDWFWNTRGDARLSSNTFSWWRRYRFCIQLV